MDLLNWAGNDTGTTTEYSLRQLVENMRKVGALVEIIGVAQKAQGDDTIGYPSVESVAEELILEAGRLVECLGVRALELLDAEAAPDAPTPAEKPRPRTTKPRAVRLCTQLAGVEKERP